MLAKRVIETTTRSAELRQSSSWRMILEIGRAWIFMHAIFISTLRMLWSMPRTRHRAVRAYH